MAVPCQTPRTTGSSFKAGAFETPGKKKKKVGHFSLYINFIGFWSRSYPNSSIKHVFSEVEASQRI